MNIGFLVLLAAGICQGSFGLGYKKYSPFSWAAFWGIYDLMCIITSGIFAFLLAPKFLSIYAQNGFLFFVKPLLCGGVWGLSAVGFSKGIDKIGMSLVYGISMGISTIVGSVTPMVMGGVLTDSVLFWAGLILTLAGVAAVTAAGVIRDGGMKSSNAGIVLSVFSGIGSGFMNVGFAHNDSLADGLLRLGYSQLGISAVKWLPVLIGGCIAGIAYCIIEISVKKEWNTLTGKGSGKRTLKLFAVSIIWYAALILYGFSVYLLGDMGKTVGWILFNALALIISVIWGIYTGEWKNTKKTLLFAGCAVLIAAWIMMAFV